MIPHQYTTRTTCRVCGSADLVPLFSLGEQYVSDFVDKDKVRSGVCCPIDIELCQRCTLVQQKHTAPQELLYTRHYWYRSGTTATMRQALRDVTAAAERITGLQAGDVVLDIGSNDGTLLRSYTVPGIVTIGVEPATNLAEEGRRGITFFVGDFWSSSAHYTHCPYCQLAKLEYVGPAGEGDFDCRCSDSQCGWEGFSDLHQARVITACGMFYDLEDPNQFIAGVAKVLAPDGLFIAQLMCLKNMMRLGDVGNLAHEHLEFYSLRSLQYLFGQHGLEIFDLETNTVNGEGYWLYVRHKDAQVNSLDGRGLFRLYQALDEETPLARPEVYTAFRWRLERLRRHCFRFIKSEVASGKRVWVYGASTKGNVILQYYGLDNSLIERATDKSPEKWGKFTIGTEIPIVSEEEARQAKPDYFLVLPYAFLTEFLEREKEWHDGGGKFLVPLPDFKVV